MKGLKLKAEIKHQAIKIPDVNMDLQVSQYTEWLSTQARQNALASTTQEMNDYAEQAGKALLLWAREISAFVAFQPEDSSFNHITKGHTVALAIAWLFFVGCILLSHCQT